MTVSFLTTKACVLSWRWSVRPTVTSTCCTLGETYGLCFPQSELSNQSLRSVNLLPQSVFGGLNFPSCPGYSLRHNLRRAGRDRRGVAVPRTPFKYQREARAAATGVITCVAPPRSTDASTRRVATRSHAHASPRYMVGDGTSCQVVVFVCVPPNRNLMYKSTPT